MAQVENLNRKIREEYPGVCITAEVCDAAAQCLDIAVSLRVFYVSARPGRWWVAQRGGYVQVVPEDPSYLRGGKGFDAVWLHAPTFDLIDRCGGNMEEARVVPCILPLSVLLPDCLSYGWYATHSGLRSYAR